MRTQKTTASEEIMPPTSSRQPTPQGEAYKIPSPLHLLMMVMPEMTPNIWQKEMLMQLAGYLTPGDYANRTIPDVEHPFLLCLPAANGSGKDQYIIAAFAVWFVMTGRSNRCIITSASRDQIKFQTEPHIKRIVTACNKKFGRIFESVEFFHTCITTGSEIKLFATDDPGHAEGYHPWPGGKMAMIVNEAKTVSEEIYDALARCTGFSYWLDISSPAGKSGHFYNVSLNALSWPAPVELGRYYLRHVSAFDCPHIPRVYIEERRQSMSEWWFSSSILALFSDYGEGVVITDEMYANSANIFKIGDDIGIGADLAAGGDENSITVRKGNHVVERFDFVQANTLATAKIVHERLLPYQSGAYHFYADDGGIGKGIIDSLVEYGWSVVRCHNQAAAYNKKEYLNLGAEFYFHVRNLLLKNQIALPFNDPILKRQLTTRYYDQKQGGKFRLESKADAKRRTKSSPDRADSLTLAFYSYRLPLVSKVGKPQPVQMSLEEFAERLAWNRLGANKEPARAKRTLMHTII